MFVDNHFGGSYYPAGSTLNLIGKLEKVIEENNGDMIDNKEVEKIIGHDVGGVCPFGINEGIEVYLDESLKKYDYIYPACGTSNSAIKLTVEELYNISNATEFIDVCKVIE